VHARLWVDAVLRRRLDPVIYRLATPPVPDPARGRRRHQASTLESSSRETTVSIGGLELFVRERGKGRPLLLVNGIGTNSEMWGSIEERLSRSARTIVFDAPGSGRSTTPAATLSIADLAAVADRLLDELGHARADVLGVSFGGLVAQQLAHDAPHRVRRLALVATACGWGSRPGSLPSLTLLSMPWRFHLPRPLFEQTNALLSAADRDVLRRVPEFTDGRLRYPPPVVGYAYQLVAGLLWSSLVWLHTVQAPTLVVAGGADRLVPAANGVQLARLLPRSRLRIVAEEGHLAVFDPTSRAQTLVEDFLSSRDLRRSPAWIGGAVVDDDDAVEAAFRATAWSTQPLGALSDAYRRRVNGRSVRYDGATRSGDEGST
jgi:poly(3-hydroxyoctanoate) depolymerase